jgi:hypothetical protein
MKIHMQLPLPTMLPAAPPKPPTESWAAELATQEELDEVTRRRQLQQRRRLSVFKEGRETESETEEPKPRPSGDKLDFLA